MMTFLFDTGSSPPAVTPDRDVLAETAETGRLVRSGLRAAITRVRPGVTVVTVAGEVDLTSAEAFASMVRDAIAAHAGGRVLLDVNGLTFLAARGLDVIAAAHHDAHRCGGELRLVVDRAAPAARPARFVTAGSGPAVYTTRAAALTAPPEAALTDRPAS